MKTRTLQGVSALAVLFGASHVSEAVAQQSTTAAPSASSQTVTTSGSQATQQPASAATVDQTVAPEKKASTDKVVITGSLIATTPEDAPKPVEVYTAKDLEERGSPNVTEFIRSLSISYGDDVGFGQSTPYAPIASGFGNANLRGVGSSGSLTLMNGRPLAPWNGSFGADVNTVPMEALAAVEVLKDGASATYGAGAVGGVINFRTRRDINAPQVSVEKQFYDGSDGYYKVDFLTGWAGDTSNLLVSLSHSHEDGMLMSARDFSSQPYDVNPTVWTLTGSNPGQFQPSTSNFYTGTTGIVAAFPGIQDYRTPSDCTALGGQFAGIANVLQPGAEVFTGFANTSCAYSQAPFQSLVNEETRDKAYIEFNGSISERMEFHFDVNYSRSDTWQMRTSLDPAFATAIDRGTVPATGFAASNCGFCNYVVPVQVQNFSTAGAPLGTFARNPFIDDFRTRTNTSTTVLPDTGALYMGAHWRPLNWSGNSMGKDNRRQDRLERDSFIANISVKGEFGGDNILGKLLEGVHYDGGGQYNQYLITQHAGDIFASRLQNAMLGYGGPNCNAVDRVQTDYTSAATFNRTIGVQSETAPGTNGCQWFNPFASGFATSIVNGAANPQFNSGTPVLGANATPRPTGYANPDSLMDWMWGNRVAEWRLESVTFDGLLSGKVPETLLSLPGGQISWALGSQWRQVEGRSTTTDDIRAEQDMATQPCVWPDRAVVNSPVQAVQELGMRGCYTNAGAFFGTGRVIIVGQVPPSWYDTQSIATFGELQLPVLDNFNLSVSARHEEYNGGDLVGDIYSLAGKWDITNNLYVRASYGTNYRAEGALELSPGTVQYVTVAQTRFGATYLLNQSTAVANGIGPEDDTTFNFGLGWQSELGEGRIRASVDFFEIGIDGQVATTNATTILNNVFGLNTAADQANRGIAGVPNTGATGSTNQFANCGASLISFVTLDTACVAGVTTAANLKSVELYQVNGPGFLTNGIDYSFDFAYPLFDGNFSAQLKATENLVYKARGYKVNGILFDQGGHRLGYANYTRTGSESRRWSANATVRWANQVHNVSLRANYRSGAYDETYDIGGLTPIINNPGTIPDVYSTYGIFPKSYLDFDLNYIYTAPFWKGLELRATILNIFDRDPLPYQGRAGYYFGTGNPRGRIIEVEVTKKF